MKKRVRVSKNAVNHAENTIHVQESEEEIDSEEEAEIKEMQEKAEVHETDQEEEEEEDAAAATNRATGLRRSLRSSQPRRPSWLVRPRRLRGYPSPSHSCDNNLYAGESEEPSDDGYQPKRRSRIRRLPRRYQDSTEEEEDISRGPGHPRGTKSKTRRTITTGYKKRKMYRRRSSQTPDEDMDELPRSVRSRKHPQLNEKIEYRARRAVAKKTSYVDALSESDIDEEYESAVRHSTRAQVCQRSTRRTVEKPSYLESDEESHDEEVSKVEEEVESAVKPEDNCKTEVKMKKRVGRPPGRKQPKKEPIEEVAELKADKEITANVEQEKEDETSEEKSSKMSLSKSSVSESSPKKQEVQSTPLGKRLRKRVRLPRRVASDEQSEDSDEQSEDEDRPRRKNRLPDPVLRNEDCAFIKSLRGSTMNKKRMRRPVARLSYSTDDHRRVDSKSDSAESSDSSSSSSSSSSEDSFKGRRQGYALRKRRPQRRSLPCVFTGESRGRPRKRGRVPSFLGSPARKPINVKRRTTHNKSSTSSGDDVQDSDDECNFEKRRARSNAKARSQMLPMNFTEDDLQRSVIRDRSKVGASLADVEPMAVERNVDFSGVGGLEMQLRSLKEMVVLPLLYPEIFNKFEVTPPRGVLFYGPPGTGKTLVARALANECSRGAKKVAFFMRKGADCLSKWVGESERQLRLLFDQAYQMRPSIIFFDEIDGLAPVRSSRQDQIHSSIVSTLLALMDGLDSRGEVIVIGATNRIEAIDPALRRPGRFDRELSFPLPSAKARQQIISVHTRNWSPKPPTCLLRYLAEQTSGYCGADLKSLCCEAVLASLRAQYPQVYHSAAKLQLNLDSISVRLRHFRAAINRIVPAGQRSRGPVGERLDAEVRPLLQRTLQQVMQAIAQVFPQGLTTQTSGRRVLHSSISYRPRLLLCGNPGQGQTAHIAPAVIHALERVPTHKLNLASLFSNSARTPEEAMACLVHEACSRPPSIIFLPHLDRWQRHAPASVRSTFLALLEDINPSAPVLLLATTSTPLSQLEEEEGEQLFSTYRGEVFILKNPTKEEREEFFKPLFYSQMLKFKRTSIKRKRDFEPLPLASVVAPRQLNEKELQRLVELEECTLRELRIFLRQICAKLARNRQFCIFSQPVDIEQVPDYLEIIREPMDLETMMTKIDRHEYICAQDFLKDIDLICANALEYNPNHSAEDQQIRHAACALRDTAYTLIKTEMDTDFEYKCQGIRKSRRERSTAGVEGVELLAVPDFVYTQPLPPLNGGSNSNGASSNGASSSKSGQTQNTNDLAAMAVTTRGMKRKKRSSSAWARGVIKKKKQHLEKDVADSKENSSEEDENSLDESEVVTNATVAAEGETVRRSSGSEVNKVNDEYVDRKADCDDALDENIQDLALNTSIDISAAEKCARRLCNGDLSTEDSLLEDISVTSLRKNRTSSSSAQEDVKSASDSAVAGLKQETQVKGVIDKAHLDAVFSSCVSATADTCVSQLQQLLSVLTRRVRRHTSHRNKDQLLQEVEAEIRRFVQNKDKVF